ncbi:MAG: hypothetical protein M3619_15050 [Myxococcota bacterium]|nr:hypothetical protein [Myxococcota bacterium]
MREACIPPLAGLNTEVDVQLEAIVRTALANEPADRYESPTRLAEALTRYLHTRGTVTTAYDLRAVLLDD